VHIYKSITHLSKIMKDFEQEKLKEIETVKMICQNLKILLKENKQMNHLPNHIHQTK
ncbi:unnamed protein product, partial [marine sediment metagenome]